MNPRYANGITATLIAFACITPAGTALAQTLRSQQGIPYLSGGIGSDERAAMRSRSKEFNLHMMFSERKDDALVAGARITIADARGVKVFDLADAGPVLWTHMARGTYRVHATLNGRSQNQTVVVTDRAPAQVYFHWAG